jgi:hypothetical protein
VNKIMSAAVVSLALLATACGDSDSSDTTTAPVDSEVVTDDTAAASDTVAADGTVAADAGDAGDAGSASGTLQEQVAQISIDAANEMGITVDEACVIEATSQLSDEDAQMIIDSTASGESVTVSPEGEAIGQAMQTDCLVMTPTT